jgi:hypothetical protein
MDKRSSLSPATLKLADSALPAEEVVEESRRLANKAEETAARLASRLFSVAYEEDPTKCEAGGPARIYPPLFEELRASMNRFENSINYINSVIDRLGL